MKYIKKREFEISELTKILSKKNAWEDGCNSIKISEFFLKNWSEEYQKQILELYFEKGNLKIKIQSPLLKSNLVMQKQKLINELNFYLGKKLVNNIEIY